MAKKKSSTRSPSTPTPAPAKKKSGRRGGRKPGQWIHIEKDSVAKYRKDAKLSRARLAELLDVSPTSIQNWETGKSIPVKRFQQRLVELMTGKPAAAPASPASAPGRRGQPSAAVSRDAGSPLELQVTRLSLTGEILKGYLATAQGAKLTPAQLVDLAGALRTALA